MESVRSVRLSEMNPVFFETAAARSHTMLFEALKKTQRVALARVFTRCA
jgi:hypothetical protein